MWAAAAAVSAVEAAAPREPVVLAAVRLVLLRPPAVADLRLRPAARVHALAGPVHRLVRADPHPLRAPEGPILAPPVLVVHLVREAAVPLQRLLSRRSCSAAMAWSSPPPAKPLS